jgi:hypothetical protein
VKCRVCVLYSCSVSPLPHPPSLQQLIGQRRSRFKSKSICFDCICSKFCREPWTLVHLYSSMLFSQFQYFFRFEETQTFLPFIRRYVMEIVYTSRGTDKQCSAKQQAPPADNAAPHQESVTESETGFSLSSLRNSLPSVSMPSISLSSASFPSFFSSGNPSAGSCVPFPVWFSFFSSQMPPRHPLQQMAKRNVEKESPK